MLDIKAIVKYQSNYGVRDGNYQDAEVTYEEYLANCRTFLQVNRPPDYNGRDMTKERREEINRGLTSKFVEEHKVRVRNYVLPNGMVNYEQLLEDLTDSITGYSVLREALDDPDVDEIQINDKSTIFVSKNGLLEPYRDRHGRLMQFTNDDEILTVVSKLIDDGTGTSPQLTEGMPLMNAKTARDQYRINAVHPAANTRDKPPISEPITNVTLRKFKEVKLTVEKIVESQACTAKMGRLVKLFGRAQLKLFCVGPTGSGKTTLLNIIAEGIPIDKRIILIQNPTEISFMQRDPVTGRNLRNVVHHEVQPVSSDMATEFSATFVNLISNALRETPDVLIIGESRAAEEFRQCFRAMQTGQLLMGTFHAESALDAIGRFATELSADGGSYEVYRKATCGVIDVIIAQYRFPDGRRRLMEISEIQGVDKDGEPQINPIFIFKPSGEILKNEHGLDEVLGDFYQTGILSRSLVLKFYKAGVSAKELEEFVNPADVNRTERKLFLNPPDDDFDADEIEPQVS